MIDERAYLAEQFKPTETLLARLCLIIVAGFVVIVLLLLWYGNRFGDVSAMQARLVSQSRTISHQNEMASQALDRAREIRPSLAGSPDDLRRLDELLDKLDSILEGQP